ncbi:MAG: hypothetical protein DRP15_04240 [Candidatus Aenigmatarchaeota archaeon]|nr:MAG: hypothetical protein DRP15_04240 [Candidatus Aenigmarchaeota archaeon]
MDRLLRALRPGYSTSAVRSHPFPTASLSEIIEKGLSLADVGGAVLDRIISLIGGPAIEGGLRAEEGARARELLFEKYGRDGWNRQR